MKYEDIKSIFLSVRDIPYRIPLEVSEKNNACVGKHFALKDALEKCGYKVRWAECTFSWSELQVPPEILAIPHAEPGYHVWLEVWIEDRWQTLDATWDISLAEALLVNTWEQFGNMVPGVPVLEMIPYNQVEITREPPEGYESELKTERSFLKAFNDWLALIRDGIVGRAKP